MAYQKMTCPSCGGEISIDSEKDFVFCSHCGTKIESTNTQHIKITHNINTTDRKIDEAAILNAKLEQEKFEAEKKVQKQKITTGLIVSVVFALIGLAVFIVRNDIPLFRIIGIVLILVGAGKAFKTFIRK